MNQQRCTISLSDGASKVDRRYQSESPFMKSTLLASEFKKIACSEPLAFADFLAFDNFLMFLDLAEISNISSALAHHHYQQPHRRQFQLLLESASQMIQLFSTLGGGVWLIC